MATPPESLFSEFAPLSDAEWQAKIIKDLKGKDYQTTLHWQTVEGLDLPPYFPTDHQPDGNEVPGVAPFRRGAKTENNHWEIRQEFDPSDPKKANREALDALMGGATAIGFAGEPDPGELDHLLKDILFEYAPIDFVAGARAVELLDAWKAEVEKRNLDVATLRGCLGYDPIGQLAHTGNWFSDQSSDLDRAAHLVKRIATPPTGVKALHINGLHAHLAGASITQELGSALAHANAYLTALDDRGVAPAVTANSLRFSFGNGTSYFLEIAKIRAFRLLWSQVLNAYGVDVAPDVHSVTSPWNTTIYDNYNNLLRATTGTMAAGIGGANLISVLPHDVLVKAPSEFSRRIARNVQLVLKDESYLDRVIDPAGGSYYIEQLTDQLAAKAWEFFQAVEAKGGMIAALESGFLQGALAETAATRLAQIADGSTTLLGVNKHPNQEEKMAGSIEQTNSEPAGGATAVQPLPVLRAGTQIENERLSSE